MASFPREVCLAWLSAAGIAPEDLRALLEAEETPSEIFARFRSGGDLFPDRPLPAKITAGLRQSAGEDRMAFWQNLIDRYGIRAVTSGDAEYPDRLQPYEDAPAILFYQGNLSAFGRRAVSFVGSRSATLKGLEATRKITQALSENGIAVISGLAYGIDAAAHQGCLKGGSPTIAVLGCGLDQDYPRENARLRQEIVRQGGLVISEYAPGEKPLGWHFPYRNRIISGLGDCLALMEARIRSGSMTSVQHALDQGKDVFVYPGDPESPKCEGNRQLLREGAIFFTSAEHIMEDMGWLDKMANVGQNSVQPGATLPEGLSPAERQIANCLALGEMSFDQLCDAANLPAAQLNAALSMLQIQGLIRALPGKLYALAEGIAP